MPQGILHVTEAAGGVLGHVHRMLGRGAVKEALAALRSGFGALSSGTCGAIHDRDVSAAVPGGERPGNGRRTREVAVMRALPSVTVPAHEASTRKAASASLEQADAA